MSGSNLTHNTSWQEFIGPPTKGDAVYWWLWDTGDNNGWFVQVGDNKPKQGDYSQALAKGIPYWKSLYGKYNRQDIWLWVPQDGWQKDKTSGRTWGKALPDLINRIIRSGPFVEKDPQSVISINMSYRFKFQFGGPDLTWGEIAGQPPDQIPPTNVPYKESDGLEIDDLAEHAEGVINPWEIRRGLITPRGYTRLTAGLISPELQKRSEQEEIAQEPSESESSESSSEEETETEDDEQQLLQQLQLLRGLGIENPAGPGARLL